MTIAILTLVFAIVCAALSAVTGFVSISLIINASKKKIKEAKIAKIEKEIQDLENLINKVKNQPNSESQIFILTNQINTKKDELKSIK